ncbi:MAG: hypothetical protein IKK64_02510 [Bacteroidales bacterium]|nr:hypothetical protein [Bacteroidales bacterium]
MKKLFSRVVANLKRLSPKTGMIILALCIPFYIISFAQMALPISAATKGVLWFVFFGLAKTTQYTGLTILGVSGIKNLKNYIRERNNCKK